MNNNYDEFYNQMGICNECVCFQTFGYHKFSKGSHGNLKASIWIVGIDPRHIKSKNNPKYWMGKSARNVRQPIEEKFQRPLEEMFYLTDIVKCQRIGKNIPREALSKCPKTWLKKEIEILNPKAAIVLGNQAREVCSDENIESKFEKIEYMVHPSPANGRTIKNTYGAEGWKGYRLHLMNICQYFMNRFC